MRLPEFAISYLHRMAVRVVRGRPADFVIAPHGTPYLRRWHLVPRNRWMNVYLHQIIESDDDRALHDHPWWNCSILLSGGYVEHVFEWPDLAFSGITATIRKVRLAGDVVFRCAETAHRLELRMGSCWSLFITGPRLRTWGFIRDDGVWVNHRHYAEVVDGISSIKEAACETCQGTGEIDERLGGVAGSGIVQCPDCDGRGAR